jgi:hypothetical protein
VGSRLRQPPEPPDFETVRAHLRRALPDQEQFLVGQKAILGWFQAAGIKVTNWRTVLQWNRVGEAHGFPCIFRSLAYGPMFGKPLSTNHTLIAWACAVLPRIRGPRWSKWRRQLPRQLLR